MAHPDIYVPKPGSGIEVKQAIGGLRTLGGSGSAQQPPPLGMIGEAVEALGDGIGNIVDEIFGGGSNAGPDGWHVGALLKLNLPPNAIINTDATVSNVVTSAEGIDRPGILLFIKSSAGEWEGPFDPHYPFGWARFDHPGHTGVPGGDVVIQAGIKNWSDAYSYYFLMKVFYRLS